MTKNVLAPVQNRTADPRKVREFAEANGLVPAGQRGRLPRAAREAFNESHKGFGSYREGEFVREAVETIGKGKKAKRVSEVKARALLAENGISVPKRGAVGAAKLAAAVELANGADAETVRASLEHKNEHAAYRAALDAAGVSYTKRGRLSSDLVEQAKALLSA